MTNIFWHKWCDHYFFSAKLRLLDFIVKLSKIIFGKCVCEANSILRNLAQSTLLIERIWKIFLFLNRIICCGYSKEPSQWASKHMFKRVDKKIFKILRLEIVSHIEKLSPRDLAHRGANENDQIWDGASLSQWLAKRPLRWTSTLSIHRLLCLLRSMVLSLKRSHFWNKNSKQRD